MMTIFWDFEVLDFTEDFGCPFIRIAELHKLSATFTDSGFGVLLFVAGFTETKFETFGCTADGFSLRSSK